VSCSHKSLNHPKQNESLEGPFHQKMGWNFLETWASLYDTNPNNFNLTIDLLIVKNHQKYGGWVI